MNEDLYFEYKNKYYPSFQKYGFASQFAIPFAKHFCIGTGLDIGCMKAEWAFPGAIPIDPVIDSSYDALNIPGENYDYIFSSHCLEHVDDWVKVLTYWSSKIKNGGVIFLYLPSYSQEYWKPWNNTKHKNIFEPQYLVDFFNYSQFKQVFSSGIDLNNSFAVVAIK